MNEKEKDTSDYLKVFSNPLRREIFRTIAQGNSSFTSLKEDLKLTDGRLFFHLKKLRSYIEKDQQNFYSLSEDGKSVYNRLFQTNEALLSLEDNISELIADNDNTNIIHQSALKDSSSLDKFFRPDFYYFLYGTRLRSFLELNLILFVIAWLFAITDNYFSAFERIFYGNIWVNFVVSSLHWYLYFLIVIIVLKLLKFTFDSLEVGIAVLTGLLPYIIYLLPISVFFFLEIELSQFGLVSLRILFVIVKILSVLVMSQGIKIASNCQFYHAFLISLLLVLVDYIYLLTLL